MILRILCGECIEPMIECWVASGPICIVVFYPTVLFGNFIVCPIKKNSVTVKYKSKNECILDIEFVFGHVA